MVVVTHEMGFARRASNRIIFMADGRGRRGRRARRVLLQSEIRSCQGLPRQDPQPLTPRRKELECLDSSTDGGRCRSRDRTAPLHDRLRWWRQGRQRGIRRQGEDRHRHQVRSARPRAEGPDGKLSGFDVDVATYVAQQLGYAPDKIEWKESPSAQRENLIENDQVDFIVATYSITDERKKRVDFAGPYLITGQSLLVKR